MKKFILLSLIIFTTTIGCFSEKDASDVVVYLSASSLTANSGDHIAVRIQASTLNDYLSKIEISSFDAYNGNIDLYEETLSSKRYNKEYIYTACNSDRDILDLTLTVTAWDNLGNSSYTALPLKIISYDAPLADAATSVAIYSPYAGSDRPDGFCISMLQPVVTSVAETSSIDIYIPDVGAEGAEDVLPLEWRSRTGIKFAKMTGVDYSSLTESSLRSIYSASQKLDLVQNLATDDVILIGTENSAMAAILITAVYDESGSLNDRILFNIKVL